MAITSIAFGDSPAYTGNILLRSGTAYELTLDHAITAARTLTLPDATDTIVTLAATQELDSKTLDSSVLKGTFTASGTVHLPGFYVDGSLYASTQTVQIGTLQCDSLTNRSSATITITPNAANPVILARGILASGSAVDLVLHGNSVETEATAKDTIVQVLDVTNDAFRTVIQAQGGAGVTSATAPLAFHGATPAAQAAHIGNPTGGATQDAEARSAINAILVVLENKGLTALS